MRSKLMSALRCIIILFCVFPVLVIHAEATNIANHGKNTELTDFQAIIDFIDNDGYLPYWNDVGNIERVSYAYIDVTGDQEPELIVNVLNDLAWWDALFFSCKADNTISFVGDVYSYTPISIYPDETVIIYRPYGPGNDIYMGLQYDTSRGFVEYTGNAAILQNNESITFHEEDVIISYFEDMEFVRSESFASQSEAYAAMVQRTIDQSNESLGFAVEVIGSNGYGFLEDMDNDGDKELILHCYYGADADSHYSGAHQEQTVTVYDYDGINAEIEVWKSYLTLWGFAGSGGRIGVVDYYGVPMLVKLTYSGETGAGATVDYRLSFYEGANYTLSCRMKLREVANVFTEFSIDGNAVDRDAFLRELAFIDGMNLASNDNGNEYIEFTRTGTPLDELLQILEEDNDYHIIDSGTCGAYGDNLLWTLDSDGVLTISGTGPMGDYHSTLDIPWRNYSYYASDHDKLTSIVIESGVTSIGGMAFLDCRGVTSVQIPSTVERIGFNAFDNCLKLTQVTIPGSVKTIEEDAFESCQRLVSLVMEDGVETIEDSAFIDCIRLETVTIPVSLTHIGDMAFLFCESITDVYYGGTERQWQAINILEDNDCLTSANIHYSGPEIDDEENFFVIGRDTNNFRHIAEDFGYKPDWTAAEYHEGRIGWVYPTTEVYYQKLYEGMSRSEHIELIDRMTRGKWGGHCFGLVVSMLWANIGEMDVELLLDQYDDGYEGDACYSQLLPPKDDLNYRDYLTYCQLLQNTDDVSATKLANNSFYLLGRDSSWENYWTDFENLVTASMDAKTPVILSFSYNDSDGKAVGHAVLVCGCEETDDGYVIYKLYDPNITYAASELDVPLDFLYLKVNPETAGGFEVTQVNGEPATYIGVSSNNWHWFQYWDVSQADSTVEIASATDAFDTHRTVTTENIPTLDTAVFSVETGHKFRLENAAGEYLQYDGTVYSGNMEIIDIDWVVSENTITRFIILKSENFRLENITDNGKYSIAIDEMLYTATTVGADAIVFVANQGIVIEGTDYSFTTGVALEDEMGLMYVNGACDAESSFSLNATGLQMQTSGTFSSVTIEKVTETDVEQHIPSVEFSSGIIDNNGILENNDEQHRVHLTESVESIAPTCQQAGNTAYYTCSGCDLWFADAEATVVIEDHSSVIIPQTDHNYESETIIQEATFEEKGIKKFTCVYCGAQLEKSYILRIYGDNRYDTAFKVADMLKEQRNVSKFENIVVASGLGFPDALSGSYLASVKNAPILLVNQHFVDEVAAYIANNLCDGGTVYLLGGETAISSEMETKLAGHNVKRLAGTNRILTNLQILEEAGTGNQEILVCTGWEFADSLSASAVGKPIMLVNNRGLTDEQKAFLATTSGKFVIIGGETAVSPEIAQTLETYGSVERVFGTNRYETSVAVARRFFTNPESAILAYAQNFPDGLCGGPLASSLEAPLLLIATDRGPGVVDYAQEQGLKAGAVLGGSSLISDETVDSVFASEEETPVREIEWREFNADYSFDSARELTGFLLQCMFNCTPDIYDGFSATNSFGGDDGHAPFYVDGDGYEYMYFSFWIPDDPTIEGWQTITLYYDGTYQTVEVNLKYLGSYSHLIGTQGIPEGLGWEVTAWRVVL